MHKEVDKPAMKVLIPLISLLSASTYASPEQKVDKLLKDLSHILDGSQLLCQENFSKSSLKERACEDLHQAACLDEKGESRYQGRKNKMSLEIEEKLKSKRDEVAKSLYGTEFRTAAKKALKDAGIDLAPEIDDYEFSRFLNDPDKFYDMGPILETSRSCEKLFVDEGVESFSSEKKIAVIKRMNEEARKLSVKNRALTPNYLEEIFNAKSSECRFHKENPDCKNIGVIKREALMLARQKADPEFVKKFGEFYDKYFQAKDVVVENTAESISKAYDEVVAAVLRQCGQVEIVQSAKARETAKSFVTQIHFSKPFIEFTLNEFYNNKRHDEVNKLFSFAKETMVQNLKGHVTDKDKMQKIEESYSGLKLHWINSPKADDYENAGKGKVLKTNLELTLEDNTLYHAFSDPKLNYFSDFNANYMSSQSRGDIRSDARVDMQPAMLTLLDSNPIAFLEVLGHEVAHKVGPDISRWNGFDLNQEHKELMQCFASKNSIGMTPKQADEVLCDYFSSLIIARYLETLPQEKRLDAVVQSVESYCLFEGNYMPTMSDAHPDAYMRISGIMGANSKIRKLIGCETESTMFKSCGPKK